MRYLFFVAIFTYLIILVLKTQHTAWIEMLVYPYFLNNNFIYFKEMVDVHTPLMVWFMQPLVKIFGFNPNLSVILTIVLLIANLSLIFYISKKIWKKEVLAFLSIIFYSLWFFYFEGNGLWFELFQTPFILLAFYFINQFINLKNKNALILTGFFLAISFYIKQSASWIILVTFFWLFFATREKIKTSLIFALPFLCVSSLVFLIAALGGYLNDLFYWDLIFAYFIFPFSLGHHDYPSVLQILKLTIPLAIVIPLFIRVLGKDKHAFFYMLFISASFMAVLPRWGLFHLQPFLAITSLVAVPYAFEFIKNHSKYLKYVLAIIVVIWGVVIIRQTIRFWDKPIRFFEPEIYEVAEIVKSREYHKDLFIFNGPDQIYGLTGSITAVKPYVQNFAWLMELPGMQDKLIESLEIEKPKYLLLSPFPKGNGYEIENYKPEAIAKYFESKYFFKEELPMNLQVFERED